MTFVFSNIEVMDVVKSIFDAAKEESFIGGFKIIFLCIYGPYACVCAQSLQSRVRLFSTLWTIARQAPLSLGFSREEYWSRLPFPSPGSCIPAAAAAAKSLQSCPTLCDPIDGSPPGSPVPGILQARTLEWVAGSFSNA